MYIYYDKVSTRIKKLASLAEQNKWGMLVGNIIREDWRSMKDFECENVGCLYMCIEAALMRCNYSASEQTLL